MEIKDWIQIGSIIILAGTAFLAPYLIERWKFTYRSPKLRIKFKLEPPGCHLTQWSTEHGVKSPVYYFRFLVKNVGKTQADDCEVFLEKISKENSDGEMVKYKNFTPVNLKWSGVRDPIKRTIYPDKETYCDIGRIHHPDHNYRSIYWNMSERDQAFNKFVFELIDGFYSQWDCLTPGKYEITISVYGKNVEKVMRQFILSWSGKWQDDEQNMFSELVIH